jgi:NAD(P)-dependent dehydrogenase (short-subunit alcohol dehydrogenase family)
MLLGLNGKTALATVASYGLGYACAKQLWREGARIVISACVINILSSQ